MKPILLAALALPVLLTGCATDVGFYDGGGYYGPGYGYYGYDRGYYRHHHYDHNRNYRSAGFARSNTYVNRSYNRNSVSNVSRSSGQARASRSASVSSGAAHVGGGGHSGGHGGGHR